MNKKFIFIFCFLIVIISLGQSELFPTPQQIVMVGGQDVSDMVGVNIFIPDEILNTSTINVSQADLWNTISLGILDDVNSTQFNNNGGTLSLDEIWLKSVGTSNWLRLDGGNSPTDEIDWGVQNLINVQNLSIKNDINVNNDVNIGGRLAVGLNASDAVGATDPGDATFTGAVFVNESVTIIPQEFAVAFAVLNFGDNNPANFNISFSSTALLNTETGLFCDFENTAFFENSVAKLLVILFSDVFGTKAISSEILVFINSSCVDVNLAIFGEENVSNITAFVYTVALTPSFTVFDNGFILSKIGENRDASFKVLVPKATGPSSFEIESIIGESNTNIFKMFTDVNGSLDTRNLESTMVSSEEVNGSVQTHFMLEADLSNNNNGSYIGLDIDLIDAGNGVESTGIMISSFFGSLITSGRFFDISRAYYDNTTSVEDVTISFDDSGILTTLFEENNSAIYIGNTFNFTKISLSVSTGGSQTILPQFFYCNSSGEWESIVMSDSTNGLSHSGTIVFNNPTNRGTCNKDLNDVAFVNTTSLSYIAIRRSELSITTPPVVRSVKISSDSSKILIGNSDTINANTSFTFANEQFQEEGSIVYMVTSRDSIGQPLINSWLTTGKNFSYSGTGNSLGVVPAYLGIENFSTNGLVNMTALSDYPLLCLTFGVSCNFNADTRGNAIDLIPGGPLLWTMGDLEIWQSAKIHKGLSVSGPGIFDLEGEDLDVENGILHLAIPVTFEQGFDAGDPVTKFTETFSGNLGIFTNLQVDFGDWVSVISPTLCDDAQCAQGTGAGSGLVEMQTNISTLDLNETGFSFVYSLVNLIGSGEFSVEVNNNVGSGDIAIFSDTTDNVITDTESIALPSSMDNQSIVTITVICDIASSAKPTRQCYFDTARLNGTAITTSTINVSSFDSVIAFRAGDLAPDGFPERGIIYDASEDITIVRGNLNVTGCIIYNGGMLGSCV